MSFKIEKPGFYRRRDGKKARVVCVDGHSNCGWSIIALDESGHPYMCETNGKASCKYAPVADLIAPWEPVAGSAEWANALPEGTKIRCKHWAGFAYWQKRGAAWVDIGGMIQHVSGDGWLLYTEPAFRAWSKPEDVPFGPVALRPKGQKAYSYITIVDSDGVETNNSAHYWECLSDIEHSTDGKTWKPCGVLEDAK